MVVKPVAPLLKRFGVSNSISVWLMKKHVLYRRSGHKKFCLLTAQSTFCSIGTFYHLVNCPLRWIAKTRRGRHLLPAHLPWDIISTELQLLQRCGPHLTHCYILPSLCSRKHLGNCRALAFWESLPTHCTPLPDLFPWPSLFEEKESPQLVLLNILLLMLLNILSKMCISK